MVKIIIKTNRFLLNLLYIIQFNNILYIYMCVCNKTKIIITKQTPVCSKFKLSITVHCMVFSDFQKNFSSNSKKKNIKWLMFDCKINGKNGQRERKKKKIRKQNKHFTSNQLCMVWIIFFLYFFRFKNEIRKNFSSTQTHTHMIQRVNNKILIVWNYINIIFRRKKHGYTTTNKQTNERMKQSNWLMCQKAINLSMIDTTTTTTTKHQSGKFESHSNQKKTHTHNGIDQIAKKNWYNTQRQKKMEDTNRIAIKKNLFK